MDDAIRRIVAVVEAERDTEAVRCARCGGDTRVVAAEDSSGGASPTVRVGVACSNAQCGGD